MARGRLAAWARLATTAAMGRREAATWIPADWVSAPDALLADTDELGPHVQASHAYVLARKPKPTRRKT